MAGIDYMIGTFHLIESNTPRQAGQSNSPRANALHKRYYVKRFDAIAQNRGYCIPHIVDFCMN